MRLRVVLSAEQERTLRELSQAASVPQRVRDRALVVRMNARGDYVESIADFFNWHVETVRNTLKRWKDRGLGGLWDAVKSGGKRRWQDEDMVYLEATLREDPRTYNSQQLTQRLKQERGVCLSPDHLRRVLKKRGCSGNEPVRAIARSKTQSNGRLSKRT